MGKDNEVNVDLIGKVSNTPLSQKKCLLPIFEAVVNSLQAIDEINGNDNTKNEIKIYFDRDDSEQEIEFLKDSNDSYLPPINNVSIHDNGIGFTNDNYQSFLTSDSTRKINKGGKGIGRFLWLKAFQKVEIESIFYNDSEKQNYFRKFDFLLTKEGIDIVQEPVVTPRERLTIVKLIEYKKTFINNVPKKLETLASRLLEHILSYFVLGNIPTITLIDNYNQDEINLNDIFNKEFSANIEEKTVLLNGEEYNIKFIKIYNYDDLTHKIHYCANQREVTNLKLDTSSIPNLPEKLFDEEEKAYVYKIFVSGNILDNSVNSQRTDFEFTQQDLNQGDLFSSKESLTKAFSNHFSEILSEKIKPILDNKMKKIEENIKKENPQFRYILHHDKKSLEDMPLDIRIGSDNYINYMRKLDYKIESNTKEEITKLQKNKKNISPDEYKEKINKYLEKENDLSNARLGQYIAHRKIILSMFEDALTINNDGTYDLEEVIHNIIFPMHKTSDEVLYENQNLWIIDERLSYHEFLASDTDFRNSTMKENILVTKKQKRPDIIIKNITESAIAYSECDPCSSIAIIEFKKPQRDDYNKQKNPYEQSLDYMHEILDLKHNIAGKPLFIPANIPFYIYIIADITPKLNKVLENVGFKKTVDGIGFYFNHPNYNAYFEVIPYNKLLRDAKKRNRILFEKLGLPENL
jgi:hypothetical protein